MNLKKIAHHLVTSIGLVTALGVFTHDSRIDKAATTGLSSIAALGNAPLKGASARYSDFIAVDAHTHPDHNAANKSLLSSFFYQSPSIAPKRKSHAKELTRATAPPRHAFDNASLPLLQ